MDSTIPDLFAMPDGALIKTSEVWSSSKRRGVLPLTLSASVGAPAGRPPPGEVDPKFTLATLERADPKFTLATLERAAPKFTLAVLERA